MRYRTERTAPIEGPRRKRPYAKAPATRSVLATDAVRETWKARDRAEVTALACERDPEAFVGARVDIAYCRPLCEACPIQAECLALGWSETQAGRAGAVYGGLHFPQAAEQREWERVS